jgi:hypothetical protein
VPQAGAILEIYLHGKLRVEGLTGPDPWRAIEVANRIRGHTESIGPEKGVGWSKVYAVEDIEHFDT